MKTGTVLLLACLVAAPALAAPASVDVLLRPPAHPSIVIRGDAGFADALSGVRGGSGAPTDPYVISGWTIAHTGGSGIRLEDTTAHVVIEDVYVEGHAGRATYPLDCAADPTAVCATSMGIRLVRASNVTIRHVRVVDAGAYGVLVQNGSRHVAIEDSRLGWTNPAIVSLTNGVVVLDSADVALRNLTIEDGGAPFAVSRSTGLLVEDMTLDGRGAGSSVSNVDGLTLARNVVADTAMVFRGSVRNVTVVANDFRGGDRALYVLNDGTASLSSLLACGNSFQGYTGTAAVELYKASGVTLVGNRFSGNRQGADVQASADVRFERNLVTGSSYRSVTLASPGAQVHNNSFVGNAGGAWATKAGSDATYNWWGDARGPLGHDGSTGDAFHAGGADVPFLPALAEAPSLDVDCGPLAQGRVGGGAGAFTIDPSSEAAVAAQVHQDAGPAHAHADARQRAKAGTAPREAPV